MDVALFEVNQADSEEDENSEESRQVSSEDSSELRTRMAALPVKPPWLTLRLLIQKMENARLKFCTIHQLTTMN